MRFGISTRMFYLAAAVVVLVLAGIYLALPAEFTVLPAAAGGEGSLLPIILAALIGGVALLLFVVFRRRR